MFALQSPLPQFFDTGGDPLSAGFVYIGTANLNPETNPIPVYWDAAGTQPAAQPIRTINGYLSRNGAPAQAYVASDFSMTLRDKRGALVVYTPTQGFLAGVSPYVLNNVFPAANAAALLAALGPTAIGSALFTSPNAAAARATIYPNAPNFRATYNANPTLGAQAVVPFNNELEDVGGNFLSGVFTVPVSGLYLFSYGLEVANIGGSGVSVVIATLQVNGLDRAGAGSRTSVVASGANPGTIGGTYVGALTAGQTVQIVALSTGSTIVQLCGTANSGATNTYFCGALLR